MRLRGNRKIKLDNMCPNMGFIGDIVLNRKGGEGSWSVYTSTIE